MAENKTKPTKISVAAFILALTDPTRRADAKTLVKLMQGVAGEKPKMWGPSIIGFGSYHYRYDSGREGDMPLIGFSPRKAATVLYNMIGFSDSAALLAKLGKHSDRQGLPLHQESRRCGPKSVAGAGRQIGRRNAGTIPQRSGQILSCPIAGDSMEGPRIGFPAA